MQFNGIYTIAEAARYAGLPAATVRSWFKRRADGRGKGPLFKSDYAPAQGGFAVSFLNLIEIHVARFFAEQGVRPAILRRAHRALGEEFGSTHPFARSDLATDGDRIIKLTGDLEMIDVITRQHFFAQMKLGHIRYSPSSKMAESWRIAAGVVIDPAVGQGKPVVEKTGVSTQVLANQFRANNDDAELVAKLYGLSKADVLNAARFEGRLPLRAA